MYTQSQHNSNSECSATTNEPKIQSTQLLFFSLHGPEFLNWTQKQENSNRFCATGGIRTLNTDCGQIGRTVEPNTVRPRRERRSVSEQVVGSRVGSRPGPPTKRKPQVFVREGSCSTKPTHCSLDPPPTRTGSAPGHQTSQTCSNAAVGRFSKPIQPSCVQAS